MTLPDTDAAQLAARLRVAVSFLGRRLRPSAPRAGLSVAKLSVLGQLYRFGPCTPSDVAAREGVKLQSLTRMLADLEAEGWLAREAHASDGRQSVLSLTPLGRKRLAAEVHEREAALAEVIEAALKPAERARLLQACALLDRLCEGFSPDTEREPS